MVGPGRNNWNMALFKAFQFTERARFEFRVETFNTFNHTQWQNPNTSFGSTQFGQITKQPPTAHLPVRNEVPLGLTRPNRRLLAYTTTAVGERTLSGSKNQQLNGTQHARITQTQLI